MLSLRALLVLALVATAARAETVVVRQFGFYFSPREVVINAGDSVRWIWTGGSHTVTEGTDGILQGTELFHAPLTSANPTFTFTFTPEVLALHPMPGGRYDYYCTTHFASGMNGVIRVANPVPGTVFCSGDGSGTPCPCGNASAAGVGCGNSTFAYGRLRGIGNASVAADTLELWADGAIEGSPVVFFQGTSTVAGGAGVVFGDGLRCAGGTLSRIGQETLSFGWARYPAPGGTPISARGGALPGSTRHYQGLYLDSPGLCSGPASNWTNGYTVVWQ